jgi:hypothetical protein
MTQFSMVQGKERGRVNLPSFFLMAKITLWSDCN